MLSPVRETKSTVVTVSMFYTLSLVDVQLMLLCSGGMWKLSHSGDAKCEHLYHSEVFWTGHALMAPFLQRRVGDLDLDSYPHVFGPPGSGSISHKSVERTEIMHAK